MTSKNIACVIGTAGHIDHGKTTLVKALTGIDTDTLAEEKKRGVSINLGFAHLDLSLGGESVRAAIVDVPGHERFIKNMLAGVTGIDLVLFTVAADDGVMPQTLEHLDIVRLLGIKKGIFAITKSDLVDADRIEEVRGEIRTLLSATGLDASPIVAVSATTGKGLADLKSLIIKEVTEAPRPFSGPFFRLPVDRSFPIKGFGTVVTGTVASGTASKGSEVVCYPTGSRLKIRGMQSLYLDAETVAEGQRAALNISGAGYGEIERGFVLTTPELSLCLDHADYGRNGRPLHVDCLIEFAGPRGPGPDRLSKKRSMVKVHHLTDETLATLIIRQGEERSSGGEKVWGRLILKKPLLMLRGDRFIIRDPSRNMTIGGGVVRLPYYSKELVRKFDQTVFSGQKEVDLSRRVDEVLDDLIGVTGLGFEINSVCTILNMTEKALLDSIGEQGRFVASGGFIISVERLSALKKDLTAAVLEFNRTNPMEPGISESALLKNTRGRVSQGIPKARVAELFRVVVDALVVDKILKVEDGYYSLASHKSASSGSEPAEKALLSLFAKPFVPVALADIHSLSAGRAAVDKVLAYLQRAGVVVRLKEGIFISGADVARARVQLTEYLRSNGSIKAAEFRDLLGCGRKLAIEILEYFDRERVTQRNGDIRTLR